MYNTKPRWVNEELMHLNEYYSAKNWDELFKIFPDRSKESVRKKANRMKLTKKWGLPDENLLIDAYPNTDAENFRKLFPEKSLGAIHSKASRLGLKRKNYFKYVNTKFFDSWSQRVAYVLGFIAADGCISIQSDDDRYQLIIQINDLELLEKIKYVMKSMHPISRIIRKLGPIYRLSICSKRLVYRLLELGIGPRKSLSMRFPNIPKEYARHFIRGVLDGDGSIGITKFPNGQRYLQLSFVSGSEKFIRGINDTIHEKLDMQQRKIFYSGNVYVLEYTHKSAKKVLAWIYSDSVIHLERKYQRFVEFMKVVQ